ncbi:MAG: hypothetical protein ACFBSF_07495 [Leptolyngbyaceae cyanobacterium]
MKPSIDWLEYQRLELIVPTQPPKARSWWRRLGVGSVWDSLLQGLLRPNELRVWHTRDEVGNLWWSAHDPVTGRSITYVSEDRLRIWMERRHR